LGIINLDLCHQYTKTPKETPNIALVEFRALEIWWQFLKLFIFRFGFKAAGTYSFGVFYPLPSTFYPLPSALADG
jgi:hypothetical protein